MGNTVGSLTQVQRSVIVGSLLGDGYVRIVRGRREAFLEVNHSYAAQAYVDWKYMMLRSMSRSAPKIRSGNGKRIAYRFTTRQLPEITELYQDFYRNGTKIIPENLRLDPLTLAVWYMDDGSKCRDSDVYLNTQQFCASDQQKCIAMLVEMGIESSMNRDKIYWRLRIKKSSLPRFWEYIAPYIIPSMQYKLGYNPVETYPRKRIEFRQKPGLTRHLQPQFYKTAAG